MNDKPLTSERLSYLYFVIPPPHLVDVVSLKAENYSLVLTLKHCVGDGTSLHNASHEFLAIIAGPDAASGTPRSDAELAKLLDHEWSRRWTSLSVEGFEPIPPPTEACLLQPKTRFQAAALKVDYLRNQETFIVRAPSS